MRDGSIRSPALLAAIPMCREQDGLSFGKCSYAVLWKKF